MLGNINTEIARDAWTTVPGRDCVAVNNENGNPITLTYLENGNVVFVQYFTYDSNGNFLKCECKNS